MENIALLLHRCICCGNDLTKGIPIEVKRIRKLIFKVGITDMLKNIFAGIEAMLRAVIYLLILLMGLALAGLGTFTILFLAFRSGQFLWALILKEKWL
jgi:predicted amino acid racemase